MATKEATYRRHVTRPTLEPTEHDRGKRVKKCFTFNAVLRVRKVISHISQKEEEKSEFG